jgi:hypothetical protein
MAASYHVNWRDMDAIGYVVSPHGFGHAARACAVIEEMASLRGGLQFEIFTTVPTWFFEQSLQADFRVHSLSTDVGLVQRTPLDEDLTATARLLDEMVMEDSTAMDALATGIHDAGCRVVICDIAPIGLQAADRLGLPGVLTENFTWDWIYRGYGNAPHRLLEHADRLAGLFELADLRIQTRPFCIRWPAAYVVSPVSRRPRTSAAAVRDRLGAPAGVPLVLLTMGGVEWDYRSMGSLARHQGAVFVVPGGAESPSRDGSLVVLPFRSDLYHPDLVHASDAVVGKLGYSTVAETHAAGACMAYLRRPQFRESGILEEFVTSELNAAAIDEDSFNNGAWLEQLGHLLATPRSTGGRENGARRAAELILDRYSLR